MNQEIPPPPLPVAFKDRKTSLTVFGILTILGGLFCALFVPLMLSGRSAGAAGQGHSHAIMLPVLIYGGLAIALIWLGIGSIMARRWARALLLILSWSTVILGVSAIAFLAAMSGTILTSIQAAQPASQPLPAVAKWTILIVMGGVFGVMFVILPAIWAFFYGSKSVKATCEARDPVVRWTDRCPLPVLAASLFLAFGAASLVMTAISLHGVSLFFGHFLVGLPGILFTLACAVIWVYCAWALYHLDSRGRWLSIAVLCIQPISAALTYSQHGLAEFYKLAGYSGAELASLQKMKFFNDSNAIWITLGCSLPWIVYLLFLGKYFRRKV